MIPSAVAALVAAVVATGAPPPPSASPAAAPAPAGPDRPVTRVLVKKGARTLELFSGPDVVATYAVAVGKGGPGPKRREGDGVTPVGHYRVVKRLPSHLRIFLEIDYPNAEDQARFRDAKRRGALPADARIGSDLGIHGEPPEAKPFRKATYRSRGCVVVEDAEIDAIARAVPIGTPVDIED